MSLPETEMTMKNVHNRYNCILLGDFRRNQFQYLEEEQRRREEQEAALATEQFYSRVLLADLQRIRIQLTERERPAPIRSIQTAGSTP